MSLVRTRRSSALAASILAHAALIAAALIVLPHTPRAFKLGESVPVTIVTSGPPAELAPAIKSPEPPAPAQAQTPVPQAPVQPAPVSPAPPTPEPRPPPKAQAPPKPAQPAPTKPSKPEPSFLDSLAASLAQSHPATTQASAGQRGADRPRTAAEAERGHGQDDHISASELGALREKLYKLWNPNCQVEGASKVKVRVRIRLTPDGRLSAPAQDVDNLRSSSDPVVAAAAQRAVSAVGRGAPYTELNPEHYAAWRDLILNFDAAKACANR
jgi:outer membrane biosynthesis protein TonB